MHGSGSADWHHRIISDAFGFLQSVNIGRLRHVFIDGFVDRPRGINNRNAERICNFLLQCSLRGFHTEFHVAAEKIVGCKISKHEVSIGDRGVLTVEIVASRSRVGTGTLGPNLNETKMIYMCN